MRATSRGPTRTWIWFLILCAVAYAVTAPGRITFPDDEIVFQTTQAIYERGAFDVTGIQKRTVEGSGRPIGSFGWEYGTDGERYGFFGHGTSLVALPMYGLAIATASLVPQTWTHAPRSDLFAFHVRTPRADWTRMVVSLTNCLVTPLAAWVLVLWGLALGLPRRACLVTGLAYALGTCAWPYTSTFLSEPLSALCLVACAWSIARWHADRSATMLWVAGALAGFSVHVHLLNLLALPCLLGYTLAPLVRDRSWRVERRALLGASALVGVGIALLMLGHQLRFGSPFESGRYDNYGHFIWPWEGMAAQVISPGRSFFLYSPAVVLACLGWPRLARRVPAAAWFVVAIVVLRWLFVSARSDWYGGWGIGPRYLVAVLPFAMLPLAAVAEDWLDRPGRRRGGILAVLVGCALVEAWMAAHSTFEHMWDLVMRFGAPAYFAQSHWNPAASTFVGFARFDAPALAELFAGNWRAAIGVARLDMLGFSAVRLALVEHFSLLVAIAALLALGGLAAVRVAPALRRPDLDSSAKA